MGLPEHIKKLPDFRCKRKEPKAMSPLTDEDKDILLKLARSAITAELIQGSRIERPKEISPALKEKRGCFVTLHKKAF